MKLREFNYSTIDLCDLKCPFCPNNCNDARYCLMCTEICCKECIYVDEVKGMTFYKCLPCVASKYNIGSEKYEQAKKIIDSEKYKQAKNTLNEISK